jgi:hypothetical protein
LCVEPHGALTGRLGYRQEDFIFIGGYDEDGPPSSGQDVDIRKRLFQHGANHGCKPKDVQWLKTTELCGCALPNDFKDLTRNHDRGKSKIVNCDPHLLDKFGCDLTKVWEKMRVSTWASYWKPLHDNQVIVRNVDVRSKKAGLGAWWLVIARTILCDVDTDNFDEAHERPAAGSADVDRVNQAPIAAGVSSGPAQLLVGRDVGISVKIIIVGASEMQYKTRTRISSLGRSNDYDIVVIPSLSHASSCFWIHVRCVVRLQVVPASCLHVAVQASTWRRRAGECLQRRQPGARGFGGGIPHVAPNRQGFNKNFVF